MVHQMKSKKLNSLRWLVCCCELWFWRWGCCWTEISSWSSCSSYLFCWCWMNKSVWKVSRWSDRRVTKRNWPSNSRRAVAGRDCSWFDVKTIWLWVGCDGRATIRTLTCVDSSPAEDGPNARRYRTALSTWAMTTRLDGCNRLPFRQHTLRDESANTKCPGQSVETKEARRSYQVCQ